MDTSRDWTPQDSLKCLIKLKGGWIEISKGTGAAGTGEENAVEDVESQTSQPVGGAGLH